MTSTFLQNLRKTQEARAAAGQPTEVKSVPDTPKTESLPVSAGTQPPDPSAPRPKTALGFILKRSVPVAPVPENRADVQAAPAGPAESIDSGTDQPSIVAQENGDSDEDHGPGPATADSAVAEREASGTVDGPANFQAKLDALDALCQQQAGITALNQDQARRFITEIMGDLKVNPESAGLVIDRDMHNIMLFVQAAAAQGDNKFVEVGVKREKKAVKAKMTAAMSDAFDELLGGASLESISSMNTNLVPTKVRK